MEASHLRRHTSRGMYDIESVKAVFEDCFMAHVSYVDNDLPACLPMIALIREENAMEAEKRTDTDEQITKTNNVAAYLHGHPSTKLMELVRKASQEDNDEIESDVPTQSNSGSKKPVKVCITATKGDNLLSFVSNDPSNIPSIVDGLVLSSAPNGHTFNYRSAVIHGTCAPVHAKSLKREVMHSVTNHIVANRWEEVNPVASFQVSLVYVVKVNIDSMSVKSRTGVPGIQPRNVQLDGPDIEPKPWTGVIPLWEQLGEPVESGLTPEATVSKNLQQFIQSRNEKHRGYSESVAR
jgi:nitroimidazol reductase NimA-like FMN-containing flavoprotein (pyridoxamine 5'-phosphate oxidase superfamily)